MSYLRKEVTGRALHFASKQGLTLEEELGFGVHGIAWSTDQKSVIKAHGSARLYYEREPDIYLRLRQYDLTQILGFHVPKLFAFDDELLVPMKPAYPHDAMPRGLGSASRTHTVSSALQALVPARSQRASND